ncbi:hypothetical protein [Paraburkholderia adhaesiva]|uniref:hypothetical protein n=1 Tax=Paraburkholderia adhaesiva TaxID=2883244 RepID=UPI001F1C642A|nr:hypothetical protein [Paraburkholderia adhaesiva]
MACARGPGIPLGHVALLDAIDLCGSIGELARRVNEYVPCNTARIDRWLRNGTAVPPLIAPFIAEAVGNRVTVLRLCPEYAQGWRRLDRQLAAERRMRRKRLE